MFGLAVLFFFGLYLALSIVAVRFVVHWARRRGRSVWGWGVLAGFVMYNLVFWDWIPTIVAHDYYCKKEAGFWVYKTPEQWKKENPGVAETLKESLARKRQEDLGNTRRFWLTQRFYEDVVRVRVLHSLGRTEKKFFDAKTGELIARSINFYRGASGNVFAMGGSLDEFRQAFIFGWGNRECGAQGKSPTDSFDQYIYQFWKWGEGK
jgi:hypothetical protein